MPLCFGVRLPLLFAVVAGVVCFQRPRRHWVWLEVSDSCRSRLLVYFGDCTSARLLAMRCTFEPQAQSTRCPTPCDLGETAVLHSAR